MKKKTIWMILVMVIVVGSVLGVTLMAKGKHKAVRYRKEAFGRGDIEALVTTSGTLNPITLVDVGSQVSGTIQTLYADYNSPVTKGQIVAELQLEPLKMKIRQNEAAYQAKVAALAQAKVAMNNYQKQYERAKSLFEKKLISPEDRDTAETSYLDAKASVDAANAAVAQAKISLDLSQVDLSYAVIRSPVDGTVINREVSVGQTIQASFTAPVLFQVAADLTKMKVECSVDEADIGRVKEGQKARFTVEAFANETFNGIVQQVRFLATTTSNVVTYTTVVNVDNPEKKLRPGMTATVSIVAGEGKNILRVPNSALRFTPDLTPAELEAVYKEAFSKMRPQGAPGGQAQPPMGLQQAPPQGAPSPDGQEQPAQTPAASTRQRRQPSKVWLQDKDGKLRVVFIRTGITDNSYTEVLKGDLKEGDEIIIGKAAAGETTTSTSNNRGPGGRGPMMF